MYANTKKDDDEELNRGTMGQEPEEAHKGREYFLRCGESR